MKEVLIHIVGGGFSGLIAAISTLDFAKGEEVLISEKTDRIGRKILSTGNGQCNLSNRDLSIDNYHGEDPSFVGKGIGVYGNKELENFFYNLGIPMVYDGDKGYPMSKQASSVLDALRFKVDSEKISVELNSEITKIEKRGEEYISYSNKGMVKSKYLIVAVGGKSAKHLGTDGSGYKLLEDLGYKVNKLTPSLVQLKSDDGIIRQCIGIRQKVKLSMGYKGKDVSFDGDLLFTSNGISGNSVFSISAYCEGGFDRDIKIDFCPLLSEEKLKDILLEKKEKCPYLTNGDLLSGFINKKIGEGILKSLSIKPNDNCKGMNINKVVERIKCYILHINGCMRFDDSQVTHGGVVTSQFNKDTMESRKHKNLFVIGELLDVDGDCGGYNLQWAFSSAMLAINKVREKENE